MWKTTLVIALAAGVVARRDVSQLQKQQIHEILRLQCKKVGAEDKVTEVEQVATNFMKCLKSLFDVEILKKEIAQAEPNGALDEVFKKYCAKTAQLKPCIHSLTVGVKPCLDEFIRQHVEVANLGIDQLIDFVCHKEGDRVALFVADSGPECFQRKSKAIRECAMAVKQTLGAVSPAKGLTLNEQCAKFDGLAACTVAALEECSTTTPANMAESVFRFVRRGSPCKDVPLKVN